MPDRLTPLDVSFLYLEDPTTPMHVGSVAVFEPGEEGFDLARLVLLLRQRIAYVPRYRQRVRTVPGRLGNPVWIDDESFDLTYHVRRSALPRPGTDEQLRELVGRLMSRRLDRSRPLWDVYLVEGLQGGRFAIITKTHQALVDGIGSVDIGQVILDPTPEPSEPPLDTWRPGREPSWLELVAGAMGDVVRSPTAVLDTVRTGVADVTTTASRLLGTAGEVLAVARTAARPAPESPLNAQIGEQRRFATVTTDLDEYRSIRKAHGGDVNDVVLAVVTGALRTWLLTRGRGVPSGTVLRALVPMSVRAAEDGALGNSVSSFVVDLPVGEPSPLMRLHQIGYAMQAHKQSGNAVAADALVGLAGFAPPTLHSLGARVGSTLSRRMFNLTVTNVPGPQTPLYAEGARMLAAYPVVPLTKGQALSIGVNSYDGCVFYGLNADRDAMRDIDVVAEGIGDALGALREAVH